MATTATLSDVTGSCRTGRTRAEQGEHREEFGGDISFLSRMFGRTSPTGPGLTPATNLPALEFRASVFPIVEQPKCKDSLHACPSGARNMVTRGFTGRQQPVGVAHRLPPGQHVVDDFP